jgi:HAD superfamily hydrolase (TIGR01509 family)
LDALYDGGVIRALLFDFDGTLVDTESICHRSWEQTYRDHGVELAWDRWAAGIGTLEGFDELAHLEELVGAPVDRDAVSEEHRARALELVAVEPLRPGVAEYLDEAHARGLKTAIVSSSGRTWIDPILERLGRDRWDTFAVAAGDVTRAKPAPTLYLEALAELGVEPHEAIAFEDSLNGVAAARAAGVFVVAVPNATTARLEVEGDVTLASFEDHSLTELLARVA